MKRLAVVFVVALGLAAAAMATAEAPAGAVGARAGGGIVCTDVWDPVICSDGKVYSNACYARRAGATGCTPYGNGGPIPLASGDVTTRGGACPAVWDPVLCSDGQVYSNACYARLAHAKGCVPTGGGPVE